LKLNLCFIREAMIMYTQRHWLHSLKPGTVCRLRIPPKLAFRRQPMETDSTAFSGLGSLGVIAFTFSIFYLCTFFCRSFSIFLLHYIRCV